MRLLKKRQIVFFLTANLRESNGDFKDSNFEDDGQPEIACS